MRACCVLSSFDFQRRRRSDQEGVVATVVLCVLRNIEIELKGDTCVTW